MNIAKNMEFVFVIAVALTCATAFAAPAKTAFKSQVAVSGGKMVSVVVTGKRLTPAQKAALGN
ncbi:MAG: hypothetical protein ABIT83_22875 [Massilia sp.]